MVGARGQVRGWVFRDPKRYMLTVQTQEYSSTRKLTIKKLNGNGIDPTGSKEDEIR